MTTINNNYEDNTGNFVRLFFGCVVYGLFIAAINSDFGTDGDDSADDNKLWPNKNANNKQCRTHITMDHKHAQ